MAKVTPEEAAGKWSRNLGASTTDIQRGLERVSEAPGAKAARQKSLWVQRVQASQDKWARNVQVPLEEWRAAAISKGLPRIASGATAAEPKMAAFMREFLPHLDAGKARLDSMPKGSLQDSINRAAFMIQHNASFRKRGTGA